MIIPAARAIEPVLAAIQGAVRAVRSWAIVAAAASATMPLPDTIALLVSNRCPASCGPSEKKRAPIDQEERTARAARRKGRRTTAGTLGRATVSRKRERSSTGSGIQYAPARAIATRTSRTT